MDPAQIAAESFALAHDNIYPAAKAMAIAIIDHLVDRRPSHCSTKAGCELRTDMASMSAVSLDAPSRFRRLLVRPSV
jgi:hypothetical protein